MTGTENHLRGLEHQSQNFVEGQTDLMKLRNKDRERETGRKRTREQSDDEAHAIQNTLLVPQLQGAVIEGRRQKDNAEDMIVDLMVQSRAWRKTVARLAEAWGVPNGAEQADQMADQAMEEIQSDTTLVGEIRTWARGNVESPTPAKVQRPRLVKRKLKM